MSFEKDLFSFWDSYKPVLDVAFEVGPDRLKEVQSDIERLMSKVNVPEGWQATRNGAENGSGSCPGLIGEVEFPFEQGHASFYPCYIWEEGYAFGTVGFQQFPRVDLWRRTRGARWAVSPYGVIVSEEDGKGYFVSHQDKRIFERLKGETKRYRFEELRRVARADVTFCTVNGDDVISGNGRSQIERIDFGLKKLGEGGLDDFFNHLSAAYR